MTENVPAALPLGLQQLAAIDGVTAARQ